MHRAHPYSRAHFVRSLDHSVEETLELLGEKKLGFTPDEDTLKRLRKMENKNQSDEKNSINFKTRPEVKHKKHSHPDFRWFLLAILFFLVAGTVAYFTKRRWRTKV